MNPYVIFVVSLALLPVTGGAIAAGDTGETRVGVGYVFGTVTLDDDFGNELSADVTSIGLSLDHFTGQSGPAVGGFLGKTTLDDFELNGQALNLGSEDADVLGVRAGYRGGEYGAAQPVLFLVGQRVDPDEGESSTALGVQVGVEQTGASSRFGINGSYLNDDDGHTLSFGAGVTVFATEEFGLSLGAAYAFGETEIFGESVDTEEYGIRAGVELRFR